MKSLPLIMLVLLAMSCYNNKTGNSYITEGYSDTLDWDDDTVIYKGDTIVYAGWLKHCDSIAIDTIMQIEMHDGFYISKVIHKKGTELLIGEWSNVLDNTTFQGATIVGSRVSNFMRDRINHMLPQNSLEQAFEINERTYDIILTWFRELISDVETWFNEVPEIGSQDQGIFIMSDNIYISPYAREITNDEYIIHSMAEKPIIDWQITKPYKGCGFPFIDCEYDSRVLDFYWDAMKAGHTKYISRTFCNVLSTAFESKLTKIIKDIKYIYENRIIY